MLFRSSDGSDGIKVEAADVGATSASKVKLDGTLGGAALNTDAVEKNITDGTNKVDGTETEVTYS